MKKTIMVAVFCLTFAGLMMAVNKSSGAQSTSFSLPSQATQVKPGLYYLGKSRDVNGREVEGYAIVHKKEDSAVKPAKPGQGGTKCYGYMANGAKWKTDESWIVNPANTRGLNNNFVFDTLTNGIGKWENATTKNVLGTGSLTNGILSADTSAPDGQNEVYFADIADSNAIAVTIVWGYFSGPPQSRSLVEWDQVYDDVTYDWSMDATGSATQMDFDNIATHELGHSFGMDDIYDGSCAAVTMYGYADYGQTNKRSLEQPDIVGVKALYN